VFERFIRHILSRWVFFTLLVLILATGQSLCAEQNLRTTLMPAEVFKPAAPAVVSIDCIGQNNAKISSASGFIIADNGTIATTFTSSSPARA